MHADASDRDNNWRGRPWSESDRVSQVAEMSRWAWAWKWGTPCPSCLWPYESFHLCSGEGPMVKSPTDE